MSCMATFPKFFFFFFLLSFTLFVSFSDAATTFEIRNQCPYTVWAAASPGGGRRLNHGQRWTLEVPAGTKMGRIWGRTHCNFDDNGNGKCLTGDCGGVLECKSFGKPPNTLAEYALKQFGNKDFYDISLVNGFNIPMDFSPTNDRCRSIKCGADITSQCPDKLKHPHGCHNPCTVFQTEQYCCNNNMKCEPTTYSKFFKQRCPTSFSYPQDDPTSTFACSSGSTQYNVVFCPRESPDTFPLEMLGSLVV